MITDSKGSTASKDSLAISRVNDMEAELRSLREDNRKLTESNEEMQAQVLNRGYEIGQSVLISAAGAASISIADELGNLPDNQVCNWFLRNFSVFVFGLHLFFISTCTHFRTFPLGSQVPRRSWR